MVSAAGINCKLNVSVYTNAAQPNRGARAQCPQEQGICWWPGGVLPAHIVVQHGRFTPEGQGGGEWAPLSWCHSHHTGYS